jgi:hypothetical protein
VTGSELRAEAVQYTALSLADETWGGLARAKAILEPLEQKAYTGELWKKYGEILFDQTRYTQAIEVLEYSIARYPNAPQNPAAQEQVVLDGRVADGAVTINVRVGELRYEATRHLPDQMMLGDELSPQAMMPGLVEGRRWTVPVYSPLRPGQSPIQILHARVAGEESMFWNDSMVRVDVVHYSDDPAKHREPRCRLWVDRNGRVLKQESLMLGSKLVFLRRTDAGAADLVSGVMSPSEGEQGKLVSPDSPAVPETAEEESP